MVSKHTKSSAANSQGGIEKEASVHISNLMVVDSKGQASRIGRKLNKDGKLVRYSKKSGGSIMSYTPRLQEKYRNEIVAALTERMGYKNIMQVPKLEKICLNQGVGEATADKKLVDVAVDEMTRISGQKSVATLSKKDISNFKLRKGMPVGVRVTLRGDRMYEFLDRLVSTALPAVATSMD